MQTHHLHAFLVLAEELNFHRAAERLSLSQPGLSEQIRALERQLGSSLFLRGRSGTQLTATGIRLLPLASRVVAAAGSLEDAADMLGRRRVTPTPRRRLKVAILGDGIGERTWSVLNAFHNSRPDVAISIRSVGFVEAFHAVERHLADAVFVIGPGTVSSDQQITTVGWERVGVLRSRQSQWHDAGPLDLDFVARRLTYDPPVTADPTFRQFWALTRQRDQARSPLSSLRTPPDGPNLPALVNQAGADGALTLWPIRLPIAPTAGCVVCPLQERLDAPRQVLTMRASDHARELARIAERATTDKEAGVEAEPEVLGGTSG